EVWGGALEGWSLKFNLGWDEMFGPIPAETEHERLPTWTRRGCASAAATAASIAMLAIGAKKDLRDIFFLPSAVPKLTTRTRFTHSSKLRLPELSLKRQICGLLA